MDPELIRRLVGLVTQRAIAEVTATDPLLEPPLDCKIDVTLTWLNEESIEAVVEYPNPTQPERALVSVRLSILLVEAEPTMLPFANQVGSWPKTITSLDQIDLGGKHAPENYQA